MNKNEWIKMDKNGDLYTVYRYINNNVQRKCIDDDFFSAVECLKEWKTFFD